MDHQNSYCFVPSFGLFILSADPNPDPHHNVMDPEHWLQLQLVGSTVNPELFAKHLVEKKSKFTFVYLQVQ